MSGTAENTFAYAHEDQMISLAREVAKKLDGPKVSLEDLLEFYKTVPAEDIKPFAVPKQDHRGAQKTFLPIIESKEFLFHLTRIKSFHL